jgi:hypothetical protein
VTVLLGLAGGVDPHHGPELRPVRGARAGHRAKGGSADLCLASSWRNCDGRRLSIPLREDMRAS